MPGHAGVRAESSGTVPAETLVPGRALACQPSLRAVAVSSDAGTIKSRLHAQNKQVESWG